MNALIADLQEQHRQLARQAELIRACLEPGRVEADPEGVHSLLRPFGRLLRAHLEAEDRSFYPEALQRPDCAALVGHFEEGMTHLRTTVEAYLGSWSTATKLAEDPDGFRDYTTALLRFLVRRIEAEESELFPRLGPPGP